MRIDEEKEKKKGKKDLIMELECLNSSVI